MRVLVACEMSGRVRDAFAAVGHDAWSCDIVPSETPGNHIQDDVLNHLGGGWDMMVAHPPCTWLSQARPQKRAGHDVEIYSALSFVAALWAAPIPRIAVENPLGLAWSLLGRPNCQVHPWWFGDPYSKRTCLWLKNLPPLFALLPSGTSIRRSPPGTREWTFVHRQAKQRSMTFPGVARAMAEQWGVVGR
jgi:hypothetical protein